MARTSSPQVKSVSTKSSSSTKKKVATAIGIGATLTGVAYAGYKYVTSRKSSSSSNSSSSGSSSSSSSGSSDSSGSDSGSDSGTETVTKKKTIVEEIPIDNYEEALDFANREWNKIKRDNGRVLECQTLGAPHWKAGEWCSVYLPSFDIDGYMYITRVSQTSDSGDWTTNLSLVDYPPGWGKEELEENTEEDEEEEDEEEEDEEEADT